MAVRVVSPELCFCLASLIVSTCLILATQRYLLQLCVFSGVNISPGESQCVLGFLLV